MRYLPFTIYVLLIWGCFHGMSLFLSQLVHVALVACLSLCCLCLVCWCSRFYFNAYSEMPSHLGRFYIKIRPCIGCKVFLNQFTMMLNFKIYQRKQLFMIDFHNDWSIIFYLFTPSVFIMKPSLFISWASLFLTCLLPDWRHYFYFCFVI